MDEVGIKFGRSSDQVWTKPGMQIGRSLAELGRVWAKIIAQFDEGGSHENSPKVALKLESDMTKRAQVLQKTSKAISAAMKSLREEEFERFLHLQGHATEMKAEPLEDAANVLVPSPEPTNVLVPSPEPTTPIEQLAVDDEGGANLLSAEADFDEEEVRLSADLDFPTLASISTLRAWVQKQVHVSKVHGWNSLGPSLLLFPVCCADRELVHRACLVAGHSYK